ncbi:hypothetical protein SXANM310S_02219 [Streptomyces xanthochromogenes]
MQQGAPCRSRYERRRAAARKGRRPGDGASRTRSAAAGRTSRRTRGDAPRRSGRRPASMARRTASGRTFSPLTSRKVRADISMAMPGRGRSRQDSTAVLPPNVASESVSPRSTTDDKNLRLCRMDGSGGAASTAPQFPQRRADPVDTAGPCRSGRSRRSAQEEPAPTYVPSDRDTAPGEARRGSRRTRLYGHLRHLADRVGGWDAATRLAPTCPREQSASTPGQVRGPYSTARAHVAASASGRATRSV